MAQIEITRRHYAIINVFFNRKKATFEEISNHLLSNPGDYDLNISKRTFLRDIADIASTTDIEILCDRKNGYVYISMKNRNRTKLPGTQRNRLKSIRHFIRKII